MNLRNCLILIGGCQATDSGDSHFPTPIITPVIIIHSTRSEQMFHTELKGFHLN